MSFLDKVDISIKAINAAGRIMELAFNKNVALTKEFFDFCDKYAELRLIEGRDFNPEKRPDLSRAHYIELLIRLLRSSEELCERYESFKTTIREMIDYLDDLPAESSEGRKNLN